MSTTLSLKVFLHGRLVQAKTLAQGIVKIGKLKSSHLCLDDDAVARMHAVIEANPGDVRVIDLGSMAGTFVNGARVDKNAALSNGDAINVGPYKVEIEMLDAAAAALSSPGLPVPGALGGYAATPAVPAAPAPMQRQATPAAPVAQAPQHAPPTTPAAAYRSSAAPAIAPQVQPVPVSTPGSQPPVHIDTSDVEEQEKHVAEVVATYNRTVLDVQHVGQAKNRRKQAPLFLGLGGLLLLAGAGVLTAEVTQDWEGYAAAKAEAIENGTPTPDAPGMGLGGLGMGLMLLGLVPMGLGFVRLGERPVTNYRIGEGHDAEFHVPTRGLASDESFPLVSGSDHGHTLNFTQQMEGEVMLEGQTLSLAELVGSGRAGANGSAYSFALPAGARCRVKSGDVTFHINEVAAGKALAGKSEADKPFWMYNAASLAAVGSLLLLTHLVPDDTMAMDLDDDATASRFVGYMTQPDEVKEEPAPVEQEEDTEEAGGQGQRHNGDEGKMGKPTSKKKAGLYAMKGPKNAVPQMARQFDPDLDARKAGILGALEAESGHFLASPYGAAYAVGNDDSDVWGGYTGTEIGEAFGVGGLGLVGTGRGGGGTAEGTLGFGHSGLIGKGGGGGDKAGYGRGKGTGFGPKGKRVPRVRIASGAKFKNVLDKDIIRRIVRNHINEVRGCYNQGLSANPNLNGRVAVTFMISGNGKVQQAAVTQNTLGDKNVGNCVAKAVRRWKFPRPGGGGMAQVTYPFKFSPAG